MIKGKVMALKEFRFKQSINCTPMIIVDYNVEKDKIYKVNFINDNISFMLGGTVFNLSKNSNLFVKVGCGTCKYLNKSVHCAKCQTKNHTSWEYKGAEPKMENKNYIPELAKMLGLKWDGEISKPFVIKEYMDKNNYHFTKKTVTNSKGDTFPIILQAIINGTLTIDPVIEFAKPIWCALDNDRYLTVLSNGNKVIAFQSHSTVDYYRYKAGNMFDPSAVIPLSQVDKIVEDMKMGYEVGDDGDSN
jgi:hypothetical protein